MYNSGYTEFRIFRRNPVAANIVLVFGHKRFMLSFSFLPKLTFLFALAGFNIYVSDGHCRIVTIELFDIYLKTIDR